jgi:predicted thioesterase
VGTFVSVEAHVEREDGRKLQLAATATGERGRLARAQATFVRPVVATDDGE